MGDNMKKVDGGLVKEVFPFPVGKDRIAVVGVWSGGKWRPHTKYFVQQFRNQSLAGIWPVVGVDMITGRDAVLILSSEPQNPSLAKGDILVFGEGSFTILEVKETDLAIDSDRAIEVGIHRYHGVALVENSRVEKIIIFHETEATIERNPSQPVWWGNRQFSLQVIFSEMEQDITYPAESVTTQMSGSLSFPTSVRERNE
jgi:hypothetical protein